MTQMPEDRSRRRILAIIVLYKIAPPDSISYQSLLRAQALAEDLDLDLDLGMLLYDNSPESSAPQELPPNTRYFSDKTNRGLTSAYNLALDHALAEGYDWLLTLDQDTHLPPETFQHLLKVLREIAERLDVAAVVPEIHASGRIVSPNYFAAGAWPNWFAEGYSGVPEQAVYAFNSGSLVRAAALRQIGGYSSWFWLDNSDSMLYRHLTKFGKRVYVAGEWKVQHDFSMLNLQEKVSPQRYRMILLSESAFWDMEMNALAGLERTARLAGRMIKHLLRRDDAELRRLTREALWSRLFRSRTQRILHWKEATEEQLQGVPTAWQKSGRPMVSVCIAAYNGERFVEAQLRSILPQLRGSDEVVIIDDASRDATVDRIEAVRRGLSEDSTPPRIVVVRHAVNRGVVRTFEEAVRSAVGDVIFLCDDDDLWAPDKVAKVLDVFERRPDVDLVSTGLALIDEDGAPLADTGFLKHRRFSASFVANILHNQFQGSAMAFRATLLHKVLPFPPDRIFLHDVWIGTRSAVAGKKAAFIDEPLLLYRRHHGNYSRRLSRTKQILLRLQLLGAHMRYLL